MRRLHAILSMLLVLGFATVAAAAPLDAFAPQSGLTGSLDIAGGTAHIPVMKEAAKRIMTVNPALRISVAGGGSGVGVQQVGEGLVAIGNTGRPLTEAEVQKYGLVSFPFAIDGVALVANPANPVAGLTGKQVADIFAGVVTNWKDVGGKDAPITLYTREDGSGTREVFVEKALKKGPQAPTANVVNSNGAMKTAIAQDPNAIGYVGIGHLGETIKGLHFDGMVPTQENAASGAYTVTRKLYMNTKGQPQGLTKAFIDYVFSPEGQEITKASGYIPLAR
ncbi:phosphate ABC transporter substrate-binding protein [Nitratidesulfovibrio sp. 1201_IL3209]|uniref:phosphate ABC transporter substrate-binding protein n=1 Tax=Nitratidesulfovibrio sp. 1201_IL3209 TaxID=3084053 RepID=UPI002FDB41FD